MTLRSRATLCLLIPITAACGAARPFTVQTAGLERLQQEEPYLYATPADAMTSLGRASLRGRVEGFVATYEEELARARAAQGGLLNTTLSILGVVLPVSGVASSIALSDPDHVQTVSIVTGAATTGVMVLSLILKPQAKAAAAAQCASYLETALEAVRARWSPPQLASLTGTEQEWNTYLTLRGSLDPGRRAACPS